MAEADKAQRSSKTAKTPKSLPLDRIDRFQSLGRFFIIYETIKTTEELQDNFRIFKSPKRYVESPVVSIESVVLDLEIVF